ncbi:MAG: nucleotidyltransferase substrate binding protein [Candidatus Berkelbacteria bacterium Licking1014_7]|uniref:Nucleotidyltransferase substrate binding protein n=1 Tax=Candidatus Berkelbacteria bacterium Licking1014_7 TaxID=2017147 RepID=A0A554LJG0_9BACT|nr:MAG: nucleotidyltransferase substrate binding protein [Candidatus Berkelbacteria bacterium Licking1014_7]
MTKFSVSFNKFEKAVERLGEALSARKTKMNRDSAILRFELCYDLSWKTTKIFLDDNFGVKCFSPKSASLL